MKINGYTISEISNFDRVWRTGNNLIIEKNGKTCVHSYHPSKADQKTKTAQQIGQEILDDFFTSAYIGVQGYEWYIKRYGINRDSKTMFKEYRRAFQGLLRLDPAGYLEAQKICLKLLKPCEGKR